MVTLQTTSNRNYSKKTKQKFEPGTRYLCLDACTTVMVRSTGKLEREMTQWIRESSFKPAPNATSTPKCNNKNTKSISKKLKIMCINCNSLRSVDKRAELNCGGGGGVDPIPCVSTHRISDPRSGPAQLLPPHVKQRSHPHGVRPQIPDR